MSRTHAVFADPAAARAALERLAVEGVGSERIELRSSVPLEHDLVPAGTKLRSRVPLFAVLGGVFGGISAIAFTVFSARAYPVAVGGMPAIAVPPTMIVAFEGIALGAILATVATVLVECRLPKFGWRPGPFDGQLAEGKILVAVRDAQAVETDWTSEALGVATE